MAKTRLMTTARTPYSLFIVVNVPLFCHYSAAIVYGALDMRIMADAVNGLPARDFHKGFGLVNNILEQMDLSIEVSASAPVCQ